jgi:hypothetical protein
MTKDTAKAIVIIIAALAVLVILLLWANHLRPPGIKTGKATDVLTEHLVSRSASTLPSVKAS